MQLCALDCNITSPSILPSPCPGPQCFMWIYFSLSLLSLLFFYISSHYSFNATLILPSISLPILFFPLLYPPTLSLTECCGASAVGTLPVCYITVPSASLNHCWARLATARLHISLLNIKCCFFYCPLLFYLIYKVLPLNNSLIIKAEKQNKTNPDTTSMQVSGYTGGVLINAAVFDWHINMQTIMRNSTLSFQKTAVANCLIAFLI